MFILLRYSVRYIIGTSNSVHNSPSRITTNLADEVQGAAAVLLDELANDPAEGPLVVAEEGVYLPHNILEQLQPKLMMSSSHLMLYV